MDSDLELLEAWQAGDQRAGNRLFELHFDAVYRFFYGKIEDAQVEELAQDTFLAMVRARDARTRFQSFRAYLFTTARNRLFDLLRRRQRSPRPVDVSQCSLWDLGPTPTGLFAQQHQQQILLQALRHLPLELQLLMELRYFEELRGPELAEVLEVPEGTVRSRLRRAHQLLREQLVRLAESPEQVESTMSDLDDWAQMIRERLTTPRRGE